MKDSCMCLGDTTCVLFCIHYEFKRLEGECGKEVTFSSTRIIQIECEMVFKHTSTLKCIVHRGAVAVFRFLAETSNDEILVVFVAEHSLLMGQCMCAQAS